MVRLLKCISRPNGMGLLQSDSSSVYCEAKGGEPRKIVTYKLRSYGIVHRELISESIHVKDQHANNRAEHSHSPTRAREREMSRFKLAEQAHRFLGVHAAVNNLLNRRRLLTKTNHYRKLSKGAFN